MFIETEDTPNPATLKFLPGREIMANGATADFISPDSVAGRSRLAELLFDLDGVARVFFGNDFVAVTRSDAMQWDDLRPQVLSVLADYLATEQPVVESDAQVVEDLIAPGDEEIVQQIKELLDTRVRPAVAGDGGDIVFRGYRDGVVRLTMQGACSGCPSSRATLKHGVENMLRHYVPEVVSVEQVEA
ncbi:Fe/S biogenesis protein NfuA [Komagataeibacter europaeus]|uniref:Nitrogen fixing thioredoxin-like protein NifU n=2 Tax=Komagataeibacter europaeus TaxID=33995 RepID=A0A0D6Q361_KOMEU|nr:NifU family protein [Komagataeibacter europaeus]ARW17535.1 NFU1 iron-sulfur cluster scaffold like protein, mitochondrial [Komagataeibacter europaeus]KON65513.1 Fe/S biogenesis protein NfuA [Komagataeibacter europaeus]GAN98012.1 nitrogen fixing thioredoxin-like protein NifU [Komagataeibacter europaeus NBRC 3261]